jgi:2-methylaconitate cis-trans-isomerase PrpF
LMGLDPKTQAQPKIRLVAPPSHDGCDVAAKALSMEALHKAIPVTVALCLAAAAGVKGSVVYDMASVGEGSVDINVEIPGGMVGVKARFEGDEVKRVAIEDGAEVDAW